MLLRLFLAKEIIDEILTESSLQSTDYGIN